HLALPLPELDPDTGLEAIREAFGQVRHAGGLHGRPDANSSPLIRSQEGLAILYPLGELLRHTNGKSLGDDAIGKALLLDGIIQRGHSASVTRGQGPGRDPALDAAWQPKESHRVGDHGAAAP